MSRSAIGEEFVGHADGLAEVAARVAAQVDDQLPHALAAQGGQGSYHLFVGVLREGGDAQETHLGGEHVGGIDALHRNLVAYDGHGEELVGALAQHRHRHLCAAGAAQHPHHLVHRELAAGHERVVDADDPVAVLDARLLARSLRNDVQHDDRVGSHVERDADPVELPFERHVDLGQLRCGDVDRVGIEVPHQVGHQRLYQRVGAHGVHVVTVDQREGVVEFVGGAAALAGKAAQPAVHAVAPCEKADHHAQYERCGEEKGGEYAVAGVLFHGLAEIVRPFADGVICS